MNSSKETSLARLPRSGDKLVDWIFKQFVFFLRKETVQVRRKRRVVDKDDPHRKTLWGIMEPQDIQCNKIEISISAAKAKHKTRDEELSTLIHELSHIVFWKTRECFIRQVERTLFKRLTTDQKNYLKSFLPRHEVKSA